MRPIPPKLRSLLEAMPRMRMCELHYNKFGPCEGRIEWHHTIIYQGRQLSEMFAILGVCTRHHNMVNSDRKVKEELERRSLEIATGEELSKYPKVDWAQRIKYLNR